jgi:type IV pilus assembly protein PilF
MTQRLATIFIIITGLYGCAIFNSTPLTDEQLNTQVANALANGTPESAITIVNQAIKSEPNNATLFVTRAKINTSLQQETAASDDYKTAIKLAPTDASILNQYAIFLCQQKSIDDANLTFQSAINQAESTFAAQIYTDWASCDAANQQLDDALANYTSALSYESAPYAAYAGITNLYVAQKNYPIANYYISLYQAPLRPDELYLKITVLQLLSKTNLKLNDKTKLNQKLAELKAQLLEQFPSSTEAQSLSTEKATPTKTTTQTPLIIPVTNENTISIVNSGSNQKNTVSRIEKDSNGRSYIIVQPADTLYSISRTTKVSVEQITRLNKLKSNNLPVGKKLYLSNTSLK